MDETYENDDAVDTASAVDGTDAERSGPFAVAPVDPIIFKQSTDNPELRAAAAYVQMARRQNERIAPEAPKARAKQDHTAWTPAGELPTPEVVSETAATETISRARFIVTAVAVVLPLGAIAAAIWFGLSLIS